MNRLARLRLLLLLATIMVGCHSASASPTGAICFDCFWEYQPVGLREDLVETYSTREYADPLIDAERHLILGRVTHDEESLCKAYVAFRDAREEDPRRRLLAAESAAFLSGDCGADPLAAFRKAADAAASAGDAFKAGVYRSVAAGTFQPRFASQEITTTSLEPPPENADGYLLGASSIHVPDGARIVMQAERTVRDWLSYQLQDDLSTDSTGSAQLLGWMEGARMQDLMQAAAIEAYPVRGVLAVRRDDAWYVADELGTFRFEVLLDKVQYASTRIYGSLALLLDTHGIAVLQRAAVLGHADLVVGCGDHPSKMQAAYRLARQGIPVWFPTDRFAGDVLGHDAGATLLGSAPVRRQGSGAIIGDTPVEFRLAEKLIVQDSDARGNARYYDSASRYFRPTCPLRSSRPRVPGGGRPGTVGANSQTRTRYGGDGRGAQDRERRGRGPATRMATRVARQPGRPVPFRGVSRGRSALQGLCGPGDFR